MSPDDVEWADPSNWYLGRTVYFAPRDSRFFVPNSTDPRHGDTINLARGKSWLLFAMLAAPPVVLLIGVNAKDLPDFWRDTVERLGGASVVTLGLFALTFAYYATKRFVQRRREREAMKRWQPAGSEEERA